MTSVSTNNPSEPSSNLPTTLGGLRDSQYKSTSVRQEIQRNLIRALREGTQLFPGVMGYSESVEPQLVNALLSGQDIILLGERGQAKTRLIRSLTSLLDEWSPILAGCEIPEDPFAPISAAGKQIIAELGNEAPIAWQHRSERYGEKLATPDITIADLIGEVDPIKIAEGRYLSDELTLHYGLVPRLNRGIFAINELPDLAERIQVGLLNVLEERDVQIRGHKVRLPLDVLLVATANPEDYTNRGRIITPLKDRYGAQIRTHYPEAIELETAIMRQEAAMPQVEGMSVSVPEYMEDILAELTHIARRSPDVNQRSGVSVRASIANYEVIVANALRRALRLGEVEIVPRISDLPFVIGSLMGKVEFEAMDDGKEEQIIERMLGAAVKRVFDRLMDPHIVEPVALAFADGISIDVAEDMPVEDYSLLLDNIDGLRAAIEPLAPGSPAELAAAIEFVFEGLHMNHLLNKLSVGGASTFTA